MDKIPRRYTFLLRMIKAIFLMTFIGLDCRANISLWSHGSIFDAKVSSHSKAVGFKSVDNGKRVESVSINPAYFPDEEGLRIYLYGETDTLRHVSDGTADIYIVKNDTLYWVGMESRSDEAKPDSPVAICRLPLDSCGQTLTSYSGKMGYWGNRPVKRIYGESRSTVTNGIDMTVEADTLHDVTMLEWNTEMRMEPDTSALIPGSLVFEDDAIDKTVLLTRRKAFFAPIATGLAGYPLLTRTDTYMITCKEGLEKDTVPLGSVSRWIPELVAAAVETEAEKKKAEESGIDGVESFPVKIDAHNIDGGELRFTLSSGNGIKTVTAYLCNVDGMVVGNPQTLTVTTIPTENRLSMPPDTRGVILLRLECGDMSRTIKIIR